MAKQVWVRAFSPLGFYPQHSIAIPGARLLISDELIMSAVHIEPPDAHGLDDEYFSNLEFLALEETRFLAGIALAVHPNDGMAYTYPLHEHVRVDFGLDDDNALIEAARQLAVRISERGRWRQSAVLPQLAAGPLIDGARTASMFLGCSNCLPPRSSTTTCSCAGWGRFCGPTCAGSISRLPRQQ